MTTELLIASPMLDQFVALTTPAGEAVVLTQPLEGGRLGTVRKKLLAGASRPIMLHRDEVLTIYGDGQHTVQVKYVAGRVILSGSDYAGEVTAPASVLLAVKTSEGLALFVDKASQRPTLAPADLDDEEDDEVAGGWGAEPEYLVDEY